MSVLKKIRKAVIPAAGLGTRFLPATKSIPKEMIPIIDVPMIQHIVEECVRAGIQEVVLVTARHKEAIENHFDLNYELETTLEEKHQKNLAEISRSIGQLCTIISVRQKIPMGLGHAVLCAAPVIGNEPFAVLLGDDLIDSEVPCIQQLISVFERENASVVGVMEVPTEDVCKYGIVGGEMLNAKLMHVDRLVEKPSPKEAPSRFAIPGRYVLSPTIFDCIRQTPRGRGGEIQLTDGLQLLAHREKLLAYQFEGTRYDTGDRLGFIDATLAFALKRPELANGVRSLMKKHLSLGLFLGLGLGLTWSNSASAYIPPSEYIVKTWSNKHIGPKHIRLRSVVTAYENGLPTPTHFKETLQYNAENSSLRSVASDDIDKKIYSIEKSQSSVSLISRLLFGTDHKWVSKALLERGIPVQTTETLMQLRTEAERRNSENQSLMRWDNDLAWVIGTAEAKESSYPQLWFQKDTFLPLRLVFPKVDDHDIYDVRFENISFFQEYPFPRTIKVLKQGKVVLVSQLQDFTANRSGGGVGAAVETEEHYTEFGKTVPASVKNLIQFYYSALR